MDWRICTGALLLLLAQHATAAAASAVMATADAIGGAAAQNHKRTEVSPYIDLVFCTLREQPWTCARQQSARILNVWDDQLYAQWQKLKVDADQQLRAVLEKRGYSSADMPIKEKPSSLLKKIEIGINYMKAYLAESMDGFLGREYSYNNYHSSQQSANALGSNKNNVVDGIETADYTDRDEDDISSEADADTETDLDAADANNNNKHHDQAAAGDVNASGGDEFIEIAESVGTDADADDANENDGDDADADGDDGDGDGDGDDAEKGAGNKNKKRRKNKNKNKKGHDSPATVVLLQQVEPAHGHTGHGHGHGHTEVEQHDTWDEWNDHGVVKPVKDKNKKKLKKRKNKRKQQHHAGGGGGDDSSIVVLEKPSSSSLLFDLAEEFVDDDLLSSGGHKKKHNYGRSNGVTRGKKKKKKKALAKLILLGTFLKAKIELLLKILGAHLQIKFFAIALIGLLINIARFWIDVKRGGGPQKVVYVEHAHHQHHYEDHGDDWNEQGSYWKRSLQTDPGIEEDSYTENSYLLKSQPQGGGGGGGAGLGGGQQAQYQSSFDPHYLAYQNQWNRK